MSSGQKSKEEREVETAKSSSETDDQIVKITVDAQEAKSKTDEQTDVQPTDILSKIIIQIRQTTYQELMPYLDNIDLVHFYQVSKRTKALLTPQDSKCIRFDVFFKDQNKRGWMSDEAFKLLPQQERFTDVMKIVYK